MSAPRFSRPVSREVTYSPHIEPDVVRLIVRRGVWSTKAAHHEVHSRSLGAVNLFSSEKSPIERARYIPVVIPGWLNTSSGDNPLPEMSHAKFPAFTSSTKPSDEGRWARPPMMQLGPSLNALGAAKAPS